MIQNLREVLFTITIVSSEIPLLTPFIVTTAWSSIFAFARMFSMQLTYTRPGICMQCIPLPAVTLVAAQAVVTELTAPVIVVLALVNICE